MRPVITCPIDTLISCISNVDPPQTGQLLATDNCDGAPVITFIDQTVSQSCPNALVLRRVWTATDACGNSNICEQRIEVVDTIAPQLTIPPDTILICPTDTVTSVTGYATANDGCDTLPVVSYSDQVISGLCANDFTVQRTWQAIDACGNSVQLMQTIRVHDTIPPVITCPRDTVLDCPGDTSIAQTGMATADDACSVGLTIYYRNKITPGSCPGVYTLERVWYAVDNCSNVDSCSQLIEVVDTIPPHPVAGVRDTLVGCPNQVPLPLPIVVEDACSGLQIVNPIVRSDGLSCDYNIRYVWIYSDACGNEDSTVQTIHVKDSIPPEIPSIIDGDTIDLACSDPVPVFLPPGKDSCGSVSVNYSDSTLTPPCPGERYIRRVYTATDYCGNQATYVNWLWFHDTVAPQIVSIRDTIVDCDGLGNVDAFNNWIDLHGRAVATDDCSGVIWDTTKLSTSPGCGMTRIDSVLFIARDSCGNADSAVARFIVQDTMPPIILSPAEDTLFTCDGMGNAAGFSAWIDAHAGIMATEECSSITWDTMTISATNNCLVGMTRQIKFTLSDECGNRDSSIATFTVIDTMPPQITSPARDTSVTCDSTDINILFENWMNDHGGATAFDQCSMNDLIWTSIVVDTVEDCTMLPTYQVVFYVADVCGNQDSTSAVFSIIDTLAPNIEIPGDTVVLCDQDTSPANLGNPIAEDNCSMFMIMYSDVILPGICSSTYQINRVWTVEDQCGNTTTGIQIIQVVDTVAPEIICPSTANASCNFMEVPLFNSYQQFLDAGGIATDNCELDTSSFTYTGSSMDTLGVIIRMHRTYQISDACGNSSSCDQLISLEDVIPPVAVCRSGFTIMADENGMATISADSIDGGSSDNCGIDTMYVVPNVLSCGFYYSQDISREVTLYVVDRFGNVATCTTQVRVSCPCPPDGIPLSCQDQVTVSLSSDCQRVVTATDVLAWEVLSCYDPYRIVIYDASGREIGDAVDESHIGAQLTYTITDTLTGNRCWGDLRVVQSRLPVFECVDDTISCLDPIPPVPDPPIGCVYAYRLRVLDEQWTDFGCDNPQFMGVLRRRLLVNDPWNNSSECVQNIYIRKESLDSLVCPDDTVLAVCLLDGAGTNQLMDTSLVLVDALGYPHPRPLVEAGHLSGLVPVPYVLSGGDTIFLQFRDKACNLIVDHQDEVITLCYPSYMIRRTWIIKDWCSGEERTCIQRISIVDTSGPQVDLPSSVSIPVTGHECKARVPISIPKLSESCSLPYQTQASYAIHYELESVSAGTTVAYAGELTDRPEYLYLPIGRYDLTYVVSDACWNQTEFTQTIWVTDELPPVPVCDEVTQVTLNPDSCRTRIYARDLDDGSYDGCCDQLHFAVASMNDINLWTSYWNDKLIKCRPELNISERKDLIDHWIDCYVFNDFVEVQQCGDEQLVLRVYEACGMPTRDAHLFFGNEHAWFCWNLYNDYACYFRLHYDEVSTEHVPRRDLCQVDGLSDCIGAVHEHGISEINPLCCTYPPEWENQWKIIQWQYPEMSDYGLSSTRRWFQHLHADCMIELKKDDKQAPIVQVPADLTVYCDGVPGQVVIANKAGGYVIDDPAHAWNVCNQEDFLSLVTCPSSGWYQDVAGGRCCVEVPWDGETFGYYGGVQSQHYDQPCPSDLWYPQNTQPWYCKMWLELDTYDSLTSVWSKLDPIITDGCTDPAELSIVYQESDERNHCGTGTIIREWTVTDACGNQTIGHQTIHVLPRSDFEVLFPADTTLICTDGSSLDATAEGAGVPRLSDDDCEQIGITFQDERIQLGTSGCYQIQRTWKLIDWCVFQGDVPVDHPDIIVDDRQRAGTQRDCVFRHLKDNGDGYMEYLQIIRVEDHEAPVVRMSGDSVVCTNWTDCVPDSIHLDLGVASDNCTPEDALYYHYDWWLDAAPQMLHTGLGNRLFDILPAGTIHIRLYAQDLCGNRDTGYQQITIRDCKPPVPYCHTELITVVMDSTGQIDIPAAVFNAGSYDNCTPQEALRFSFTKDGTTPSRVFDCQDIPNGKEVILNIQMWVFDEGGNADFCQTRLRLQDNSGNLCRDSSTDLMVQGNVHTVQGEGVEEVTMLAMESGLRDTTGLSGDYEIHDLQPGVWYTIRPHRNNDPLNGVTTLDLVHIQKHLLGMVPFETPYQFIAADIDKSNTLNVVDLVELRKLILGVLDSFPHNTSWRFVPQDYQFPDDVRPWDFPEKVDVLPPVPDSIRHNFIGIKIGDLNGTVLPNGLFHPELRSNESLILETEDLLTLPGDTLEIPVFGLDYHQITGWQWTLDLGSLKLLDILPSAIPLTNDHFGLRWANEGLVTMSWNQAVGDSIASDQPLFILRVLANGRDQLSDVLRIGSRRTPAEAYRGTDEVLDVTLQFHRQEQIVRPPHISVYQNHPNPFHQKTWIGFDLPLPDEVTIRIIDQHGREIKVYHNAFTEGYHEVEVNDQGLPDTGVLYYQVESSNHTVMKKMIRIQ
ncbi:MAG: T9SS type A sorting domain-containing protein [Saprospiraceae bacterium]|nr:T9SS type A sorting domain-containing protein [Saprospiraceae bacterium]